MATEDQLEVSKMMIDNSSSSLSYETGGEEATDWLAEGSSPCFVERSDTAAGLYDIPMMGINSTLFLGSTPDKESERVIAWCVEDKQVNTMGGDQGCSSRTTWLGFCFDNDPLFAPQQASPPKMEQEVEQERAKSNGFSFTSSCTKNQPKDKTLNLERLQQRCTTPIWGWPEFSFKKEAIKNENELGDRPTTMHPRNSLHFHSGGVSKKSGEASNGSSLVAQDDVSGLILADKDIRKRKESFLPGRELLDEVEFFSPDNVESSLLPPHLRDVASDVCSHAEASSFLIKHDIGSITKNAEKCFQRIVSPLPMSVEDVLDSQESSCIESVVSRNRAGVHLRQKKLFSPGQVSLDEFEYCSRNEVASVILSPPSSEESGEDQPETQRSGVAARNDCLLSEASSFAIHNKRKEDDVVVRSMVKTDHGVQQAVTHSRSGPWTPQEDQILLRAVKTEGGPPIKWKFISEEYFGGSRTGDQCKSRWRKVKYILLACLRHCCVAWNMGKIAHRSSLLFYQT